MVSIFLLVVSIIQGVYGSVPVVIWGGGNNLDVHPTSPLQKIPMEEFSDLVKDIVSDKSRKVAVFVQRTLSSEDLGWRDVNDKSAYPNLENELTGKGPSRFFSYVHNPIEGLKSLSKYGFQVSEFDDKKLLQNSKNLFILTLEEPEDVKDRITLLRNHDNFIHETCSKIKVANKDAICILTGLRSTWIEPNLLISSRQLLQATDSTSQKSQNLNYFHAPDNALFYTSKPPLLRDLKKNEFYNVTFNDKSVATGSRNPPSTQKISVNTDVLNANTSQTTRINLQFVFTLSNSSLAWQLDYINCKIPYDSVNKITLNSSSDISGHFNFSYHTPSTVVFGGGDYELTFYSLQIELFNGYDRQSFSSAEDTVGFFTIPIWSGIFVTSLLVTIVLVGLSLIFDIKTMDQFDDPKGKPLTINASE